MRGLLQNNKSLLQLSGANVLVLALPTLLLPVFSRLYSVSDFAQFGLFTNILSLLLPFVSWHYQQAIPVPAEKQKIKALTQLCLLLAAATTLVISLSWFFIPGVQKLIDPDGYLMAIPWVLPLGLILTSYIQVLQHWILQGGLFKRFATSKSALAISQSTYRYLLGATNWFSAGLIWSYLGALATQILVFGRRFAVGGFVGWRSLLGVAREYASFLRFGMPASMLLSGANFLPLIILTHFFSEDMVGQYSMALRLGSIPIFLLATAFGQVYFADCKAAPKQLATITEAFLQKSLRLTGPIVALGFFIAKPVGGWVIGTMWMPAIDMVLILLPALWLNFSVLPLTHLFELRNRQRSGFYYAIWCLVLRLFPMLLALGMGSGIYTVIVAVSLGGVFSNAVGLAYAQNLAECNIYKVLKNNILWLLLPIIAGACYFIFLV